MLSHVQRVTDYILCHEDYFRKVMEEQLRVESTEKLTVLKKQLARNEKRIADLKRLFMKIYEDNASGKLSDERFDMMSQSYDAEQKHLEEEALLSSRKSPPKSGEVHALLWSTRGDANKVIVRGDISSYRIETFHLPQPA